MGPRKVVAAERGDADDKADLDCGPHHAAGIRHKAHGNLGNGLGDHRAERGAVTGPGHDQDDGGGVGMPFARPIEDT